MILATAIFLIALSGCGGNGSAPDYLRLDGATANIPLAIGFYREYYGLSQEEAEELAQFSKSSQSYLNLLEGEADLLLVSRADLGTQEAIDKSGIELEYIPLRRDALCFIVPEENPIESLTDAQIKDIYQGKITRWGELGWVIEVDPQDYVYFVETIYSHFISPYQRNEDSGSQAMMRRLVMDGLEMMAPIYEVDGMYELVGQIAEFNEGNPGAIGYTTFYFAGEMFQQPGVKFLKVEGIAPTVETIGDGSYPYLNENHIVLRAGAAQDGEVRKAVAWLLSDEGKALMESLNYIPVA